MNVEWFLRRENNIDGLDGTQRLHVHANITQKIHTFDGR